VSADLRFKAKESDGMIDAEGGQGGNGAVQEGVKDRKHRKTPS
jgi:hypothetical protein